MYDMDYIGLLSLLWILNGLLGIMDWILDWITGDYYGLWIGLCNHNISHDGSMVLVYTLTWLGYIDGIHVTIYSSTMDPMGYGLLGIIIQ